MVLPTFLIIGAARSGTTTLYAYVQEHRDVFLPEEKRPEPHFFLRAAEYAKGIDYYAARYFSATEGRRAIGEASTSYLYGVAVPGRIQRHLPEVRLIALLRNPIDRAFSSYWHTVRAGLETMSFAQAIDAELSGTRVITDPGLAETDPFAYLGRGFYAAQLDRYLSCFAPEQLLVLLFDDLCLRPAEVVARVLGHIGVEPGFVPNRLDRRENASVPSGERVPSAMRKRLAEVFRSDVDRLSQMLGRDLSHWLV